jgi:hypothetical protein
VLTSIENDDLLLISPTFIGLFPPETHLRIRAPMAVSAA